MRDTIEILLVMLVMERVIGRVRQRECQGKNHREQSFGC